MTDTIRLMNEILHLLETYANTRPAQTLNMESFLFWLNQQMIRKDQITHFEDHNDVNLFHSHVKLDLDQKVSQMLFHLSRFTKIYIKKALENLDLISIEDFYFLAMLSHRQSMKKSELVYENILEMPSGIEVIKRLLRHQLIIDYPDPDDKRSKRVKITPKGIEVVRKSMKNMTKLSQVMIAPLSDDQKVYFLSLLHLLNEFHLKVFQHEKEKTLDELMLYQESLKRE
jgi:DNA-binding MarR family transcriptional regulator